MKTKYVIFLYLFLAISICLFISSCGGGSGGGVTGVTIPSDEIPSANKSIITGTVYDTDQKPVGAGLPVTLKSVDEKTGTVSSSAVQNTTTNEQGQYSFTVTASGSYTIEAISKDAVQCFETFDQIFTFLRCNPVASNSIDFTTQFSFTFFDGFT